VETFFASCPRGLEQLLVDDLSAAGARDLKQISGGVHFLPSGRFATGPICTRELPRASCGGWRMRLMQGGRHLPPGAGDAVATQFCFRADHSGRCDCRKKPLKSIDFVTLRIKDAICDRFRRDTGKRPSVDTRQPDVRVHGFLSSEDCTLYLDTSGAPLYQRGFRQKTVDAPLKENLAAGILRLSGWHPGVTLLDPMCGSGTFLIEAAQIALGIAPGPGRSFAFQRLRHFDAAAWKRLLDAAQAEEKSADHAGIFGSDLSPVAVRAALANLDRAGLLPAVTLSTGDLLEISAPASHGILVSNPPYGERVSDHDELAEFYPLLGSALKRRFAGWNCYLLSADTRLPKLMRLTPSRKTPLFNGALECRLYEFRMVAGSNRGTAATPPV
jgi:putative N6-adenine-specific DNA methylase